MTYREASWEEDSQEEEEEEGMEGIGGGNSQHSTQPPQHNTDEGPAQSHYTPLGRLHHREIDGVGRQTIQLTNHSAKPVSPSVCFPSH